MQFKKIVIGVIMTLSLGLGWFLQSTYTLSTAGSDVLLMDTFVSLSVTSRNPKVLVEAVVREMELLEGRFTAHVEGSEVHKINNSYPNTVAVSAEVMDVLLLAREIYERTEGAFDVTVGPLLRAWGFGTAEMDVPSAAELARAREGLGFTNVLLDPEGGTVRLLHPDTRVDLGGIAKGYIVDRAMELLAERGAKHAVVDAGGDVRILGGRPGQNARDAARAARVGIRHPRRPGDLIAVVSVFDGSVLTSGDYERYFFVDGVRYSHIIDPRTGYPARGLTSVTIVSQEAMLADSLSTAVFVMGPEKGLELINSWPGVEGMLVTEDEQIIMSEGMARITEY
jgi:thiamine biosynthesis lipoprotein